MTETGSLDEYLEQADFIKQKVQQIANDVMEVLSEDLPKFIEREVKKRFIESVEFSKGLTDDTLRKLKEAIGKAGREESQRIVQSLKDLSLWITGREYTSSGRSLMDNPKLWAVVDGISQRVEALFEQFGFPKPEGGFGVTYKSPTWFIAGKYMPSLAEAYWKRISELLQIEKNIEAATREKEQEELRRRWDEL